MTTVKGTAAETEGEKERTYAKKEPGEEQLKKI